MQIIYLFFVLFLFLIFFPKPVVVQNNKDNRLVFFNQGMLLLFFIALFFGLRNVDIGVDSKTYLEWFRAGDKATIKEEAEKGFELLIYILHKCLFNDKSFLFVMSFFIVSVDFIFYYNLDKTHCLIYIILMSCFYYFYIFHLSMYRQAIAIGLVDLSYLQLRKNNKIRYLLLGLMGFSIHYSALIFVFFPFFQLFAKKIKSKRQHTLIFVLMILFFMTTIVKSIVSLIPDFCYPVKVLKSYIVYMNLGSVHITHSHFITIFIMFCTNIFFNQLKRNQNFDIYIFHSLYFAFIALFKDSVLVYDRFYFYIQLFEPFLIFQFYNVCREKKMAKIFISCLVLLYSLFTIFLWGPRNLIQPYYF